MIFVTVGTQLPFDRLIEVVDSWAFENPNVEVFCQVSTGSYLPKNCKYKRDLNGEEFNSLFKNSDVVVSHAGMGSIISAFEFKKPLIVFPRIYELGEHRNNHQSATARKFHDKKGLYFATDKASLYQFLNSHSKLEPCEDVLRVSSGLISKIVDFCETVN